MFNCGDVVKFRSKEELEILFDKLVVMKYAEYKNVVMSLANTIQIVRAHHNNQCTFEGIKDNLGYWLFNDAFFVLAENSVPSLFGV